MASDNVTLNPGSGGATFRTFGDSFGNEWSAAVVCYAAALSPGANTLAVVTGSSGLPVAQQGTWTVQPGNTVNTTAWLVNGAGGTFPATQSGSWTVGVSGSVAVTGTFYQATQPVSGTFWQATQPVSQSGTWNVGTVTTVTTVSAVTAITDALPAGTNLLGQVAASQQVASLFNGTTAVTPQYAAITASASGATTVVSAVAGKKVYILRWSLSANGAVNINWQSHTTTGTATGLHYMTQYATAGGAYCPAGIFATASGEALDLNLSAAIAVGGELTYVQF